MSCSAYGCSRRHSKGSDVNFFRFPLGDNARLKQWLLNVRRRNWIPSKSSRLCSTHFKDDQFFIDKEGKRRLKDTAVPTIFIFQNRWLIEDVTNTTSLLRLTTNIDNGPYHSIANAEQAPIEEEDDVVDCDVVDSVFDEILDDDIVRVIVGGDVDEVVSDDNTECETSITSQSALHDHSYRSLKQEQIYVGTDHNYIVSGSPRTLKRKVDAVQDQLVLAHKKLKLKCQETRRMKSRLLSMKNLTKDLKKKLNAVEKTLAAVHK
ncbi:THAP domain-containing protein 5-like isoform X2 [Anarrhichthys ocellatus]|uniref:THAP domain-containing protein 5-like isoform X2 n=1 Tax=Anarrhichthys ocellatus TaxID=433405 RepID=UPI0012ED7E28|nr:THAP domain-containing protein 5-like isoform X2 [Anarrhichthys ocellatus]